jgi:hypothetical protein
MKGVEANGRQDLQDKLCNLIEHFRRPDVFRMETQARKCTEQAVNLVHYFEALRFVELGSLHFVFSECEIRCRTRIPAPEEWQPKTVRRQCEGRVSVR